MTDTTTTSPDPDSSRPDELNLHQADVDPPDDEPGAEDNPAEDVFDRAYVEDLRKESAGYRTQLRAVQEQLHHALVEQTGLLADPADLVFDPAHLDDPDTLTAAISTLVENKPHLKRRTLPAGGAAQGPHTTPDAGVSLLDLLRGQP